MLAANKEKIRRTKQKSPQAVLVICLAVLLVASFFSWGFQSSWGGVKVSDLRDETNSGPWAGSADVAVKGKVVSGLLFVPKAASAENKLPGIVLTHGYLNNRELQLQNAIELSRRGFVVLSIDREAHGNYENTGSSSSLFARGLYDAAKYLYNLEYVDQSKIGVSGHSMGGCDTAGTLMEDAPNVAELSMSMLGAFLGDMGRADLTPENGYGLGIVSAGLLQGWDNFAGAGEGVSVGIVKANDDEFFFGTGSWANRGNSLPDGSPVRSRDYLHSVYGARFVGLDSTGEVNIQNGGIYLNGALQSVQEGTAAAPGFRAIYESNEIHPLNHFSTRSAAAVVNFFYTAFGTPNGAAYRPSSSQVWCVKEAFSCIALAAFFALFVPLADVLLATEAFSSLRRKEELPAAPALVGVGKNLSYWGTGIVCTLVSGLTLAKFCTEWGKKWFPLTPHFPQDTTNWVAMWAVGTGLFALLFTLLVWKLMDCANRKAGREREASPLAAGHIEGGLAAWGKTLLLAGVMVAIGYAVLYLVWGIWKVDFRVWTLDVKVFDIPTMLPTMLRYAVIFGIFYCSSSVLNQSYRLSNLPEWATVAINAVFNVFGIVLVIAIQYITFKSTGVLWKPEMNLGYIVAFPLVPVLIIATLLSRSLYKKTGNAWLGGMLNALLFTIITVANTASSFSYILA